MSFDALPCIKCGKQLRNVEETADNQPYCGTEFTTIGHYGSTIHDEMGPNPMKLVVNICDTCILRAIDADIIQSRPEDNSIHLSHHPIDDSLRAWVLAQNDREYGCAWGDDEPVDYRLLMKKAGWPAEMLDQEEQ